MCEHGNSKIEGLNCSRHIEHAVGSLDSSENNKYIQYRIQFSKSPNGLRKLCLLKWQKYVVKKKLKHTFNCLL